MKSAATSMSRLPVAGSIVSSITGCGWNRCSSSWRCLGCVLVVGEEAIGDAHFVQVGVTREGGQIRLLCLPAEAADAHRQRGRVPDHRYPATYAVGLRIAPRVLGDRCGATPGAAPDGLMRRVALLDQNRRHVIGNRVLVDGFEAGNPGRS